MNGKVVQRFISKGEPGATLYLVADDSAKAEAAHLALNTDVWFNSGEQGTLVDNDGGKALGVESRPVTFPNYIAKVPPGPDGKPYIPKASKFTTDRAQALTWGKELAHKAIPSALLTGPVEWARTWRPYSKAIDAAKSPDELWKLTQEIRGKYAKGEGLNTIGVMVTQPKTYVKAVADGTGLTTVAKAGVDLAKGAAEEAGKAAASSLGELWDEIPTPYKVIGGLSLGALLLNAVLPSGHSHDEEE